MLNTYNHSGIPLLNAGEKTGSQWFTRCIHCGKQNLMLEGDGPDTPCEFCHKPVGRKIKEENMILKVEESVAAAIAQKRDAEILAPPVPPRPAVAGGPGSGKQNLSIHRYYEDNKAAILNDFTRLGEKEMCHRWGMSSSTWRGLRWKWLPNQFTRPPWQKSPSHYKKKTPEKAKAETAAAQPSASNPPRENTMLGAQGAAPGGGFKINLDLIDWGLHRMPAFPAFNEAWTELVKLRWFDTYKELAKK